MSQNDVHRWLELPSPSVDDFLNDLVALAKTAGKVLLTGCAGIVAVQESTRADEIGDTDMTAWTEARNNELAAVEVIHQLWKPAT